MSFESTYAIIRFTQQHHRHHLGHKEEKENVSLLSQCWWEFISSEDYIAECLVKQLLVSHSHHQNQCNGNGEEEGEALKNAVCSRLQSLSQSGTSGRRREIALLKCRHRHSDGDDGDEENTKEASVVGGYLELKSVLYEEGNEKVAVMDLLSCSSSMTTTTATAAAASTLWILEHIGDGTLRLIGCKMKMMSSLDKPHHTLSIVEEHLVADALTTELVLPPVVNIAALLRDPRDEGNNNNGGDTEEEIQDLQLKTMQRLLDAAQDTGYFFICGCSLLEKRASELLRALQCCAASAMSPLVESNSQTKHHQTTPSSSSDSGSHYTNNNNNNDDDGQQLDIPNLSSNTITKVTLLSSTGLVKVSSSPEVHHPIVLPQWIANSSSFRDAITEDTNLVVSYYAEAKRVSMVLMESLMQDDVRESDMYFLMRSVIYPPSTATTTTTTTTSAVHHPVAALASPAPTLDAHTDKSWITILACTSVDGLEYVGSDGKTFVAAAVEGALQEVIRSSTTTTSRGDDDNDVGSSFLLMVNIGDAFQMKSRGLFLSRMHQARNNNNSKSGVVAPTLNALSSSPSSKMLIPPAQHAIRVSVPLFVEPGVGCWPKPYDADELMVVSIAD